MKKQRLILLFSVSVTIIVILLVYIFIQKGNSDMRVDRDQDLNQTITLTAPEGWNTFELGKPVYLLVYLQKNIPVILDDHDVEIFQKIDVSWIPVENNNPHPNMFFLIEPNQRPALRTAQIIANPIVENLSGSTVFKFVVTAYKSGDVLHNKPLTASVEISLKTKR